MYCRVLLIPSDSHQRPLPDVLLEGCVPQAGDLRVQGTLSRRGMAPGGVICVFVLPMRVTCMYCCRLRLVYFYKARCDSRAYLPSLLCPGGPPQPTARAHTRRVRRGAAGGGSDIGASGSPLMLTCCIGMGGVVGACPHCCLLRVDVSRR